MQINFNNPPRQYFCGHAKNVQINDLGSVDLRAEDYIIIENQFCHLVTRCCGWGLRISVQPRTCGSVIISGVSWRRAHIMFVSQQCDQLHLDYSLSERHTVFWKSASTTTEDMFELQHKRLELGEDHQITVKHKGDNDFDVTSKNWGFYITPSLFSRCKKFGLLPYFIHKAKSFETLIVYKSEMENFLSDSVWRESKDIRKLDEHNRITPVFAD